MEEITGPVIAITLVLSSVFIPTAFIAGISGQFFKQFALTIAASTIISAVNAMTMAPARAVTLIKPHSHGHGTETREALPRLGVALLLGAAAYFLLVPIAGRSLGLASVHGEHSEAVQTMEHLGTFWAVRIGIFLAGGVAGWFLNPLVNWILLRFFDGFNWVFDLSPCTTATGKSTCKRTPSTGCEPKTWANCKSATARAKWFP